MLSIPSGLCLGPEGPIIHIGALLAHHTTHFFQTLSHKLLPDRFHFTVKPGEGRDFLATGAAVGICVAFRAPLAGCLFVVEEAASFFTTEHLEYTFFATVVAYMVALALAQPDDGFTKFKQATGYFCSLYDWFDIAVFIVISAVGGASGALFNHIVEELSAQLSAFPGVLNQKHVDSIDRCFLHFAEEFQERKQSFKMTGTTGALTTSTRKHGSALPSSSR